MPETTTAEIFKATIAKLMRILKIEPSGVYELMNEMEQFQVDDDRPWSDDF